jgi:hypothetical protein
MPHDEQNTAEKKLSGIPSEFALEQQELPFSLQENLAHPRPLLI